MRLLKIAITSKIIGTIMIVCQAPHPAFPDQHILIRQSDHDDHAGRLMAHWDTTRFWVPTSRQLLTTAVAVHDAGSSNWEDHAALDEQGQPWTYWGIPPDEHLDLHRRTVEVGRQIHPYVGLLVSMHTVGVHRDRLHIDDEPSPWHIREDFTPAVNGFVEEQTALQNQLRVEAEARLGQALSQAQLMNDFRVFELMDTISVWIGENMPMGRRMVWVPDRDGNRFTVTMTRAGDWEFRFSPFPFVGERGSERLECPIVARLMPKITFENEHAFHEAWYASKVVTLPFVCTAE